MVFGPHAFGLMPQSVLMPSGIKLSSCGCSAPSVLCFFGGIALATAPAPALSIVNEFHARGPVTDTLLPMTVLDDVVGTTATMLIGRVIKTYLYCPVSH